MFIIQNIIISLHSVSKLYTDMIQLRRTKFENSFIDILSIDRGRVEAGDNETGLPIQPGFNQNLIHILPYNHHYSQIINHHREHI